jgi:hypothetical protein
VAEGADAGVAANKFNLDFLSKRATLSLLRGQQGTLHPVVVAIGPWAEVREAVRARRVGLDRSEQGRVYTASRLVRQHVRRNHADRVLREDIPTRKRPPSAVTQAARQRRRQIQVTARRTSAREDAQQALQQLRHHHCADPQWEASMRLTMQGRSASAAKTSRSGSSPEGPSTPLGRERGSHAGPFSGPSAGCASDAPEWSPRRSVPRGLSVKSPTHDRSPTPADAPHRIHTLPPHGVAAPAALCEPNTTGHP